MIKKKERIFGVNYDVYEPESLNRECASIQKALKPLGFEVIGIRQKCPADIFVLHLRPFLSTATLSVMTEPGEKGPPSK